MNIYIKHFIRAFLIGFAIFILFTGIEFYINGSLDAAHILRSFIVDEIFSITLYFANWAAIRRVMPEEESAQYSWRTWLRAVGVSSVVTLSCIFVLRGIYSLTLKSKSLDEFLSSEHPINYWMPFLVSVVIVSLFFLFYYYKHKKDSQVEQQKMIAGTATAQFDALKNQLDPHFLFNSLNVLSSLIEENPDAAQDFTTGLSKVYRYVLEQKNKELVPLDEELRFARSYMALVKMRFEKGVSCEIPVRASDPDLKVVPLSLQLLLENAVKHNRVSPALPLHIKIEEKDDYLMVSNNLQTREVIGGGNGIGLQNIKQRYQLLTRRKVQVEKDRQEFRVYLPLLSKQVKASDVQRISIDQKRFERAKKRVETLKKFYSNLASYLVIIPFLAWLNYKTSNFPWVIFPVLGWGFGVITHGLEAYGYNPLWGKRWEERKIRQLMEESYSGKETGINKNK
ncbi:2TM domain-containing protein [Robertkochia aurantiaca]|uniref:2TM domain-containing protein n=1 Tax=Robertkochia aurantiaca TaxID=2873700 RepID=UPI001CCE451F|nr:2TM domain-containing protein [Robertkochia sp. 3YJGBD-33]